MKKGFVYLYAAGIILCLLCIWLPPYFITGDGPCHAYNATMLKDIWLGQHTQFYKQYFTLSSHPNPNWFGHLALATLLLLFKTATAEKILYSFYVLVFTGGFYKLVQQLQGRGKEYLALPVLLLVFNHPLAKGFFNFAISYGFALWLLVAWLRVLRRSSARNVLLLVGALLLCFLAHPLGFAYGTMTAFGITISHTLYNGTLPLKRRFKNLLRKTALLACCVLPFILLLVWFSNSAFGGAGGKLPIGGHLARFKDLPGAQFLMVLRAAELTWTAVAGYTILLCFAVAVYFRCRQKGWQQNDGLIFGLLFGLAVYAFVDDWFLGAGLLEMRAQVLLYLLLLITIAGMQSPPWLGKGMALVSFGLFMVLSTIRLPHLLAAGRAAADYASVAKHMQPETVVLPLSFSHNGKDEAGNIIGDANWLFSHAGEYIGGETPTISLQNYEGNVPWFPFHWREDKNPYNFLSYAESIEGQPPCADIDRYRNGQHVTIDYVVLWCYDSTMRHQGHVDSTMRQIEAHYRKVYTTPSGRTQLWQYAP